jgi:hypothetical protein
MKANELRIGNYYNQFSQIEKVSWVTFKDLAEDLNNKLWCKPIPLTEEWLFKFGFKCFFTYDDYHYYLESIGLGLDRSYQPFGIGNYKVEYVHQLQNLYFALMGEELTFKSE